jgi:hypothetical protein
MDLGPQEVFRVGRAKLRVGDVFSLPLEAGRVGVGQIVGAYIKGTYYFAIYGRAWPGPTSVDLDEAIAGRVSFLALSLDAKLSAGHWTVLGNRPVPPGTPFPAFKEVVGTPDRVDVVDHTGQWRRPARGAEAELLPNRKVVAPVRLEKALRARHGLEPWVETYAELVPDERTTTARMFS